jgi:GNAT superfamily N-acetyltransferase
MNSHYSLDVYDNDDDDGIIGEDFEKYVRIDYVIVDKDERGKGVGRTLLRKAIEEAKTYHLPIFIVAMALEQDTDLERLVSFYESEGFDVHSAAGDGVLMQL